MENPEHIVLERLKESAPIGTACAVVRDNSTIFFSRTKTAPYKGGAGDVVVFVEGVSGYYAISRVYDASSFFGAGVALIAGERSRQMRAVGPGGEGWTPAHDDEHIKGELAVTAACYAAEGTGAQVLVDAEDELTGGRRMGDAWPWNCCHDKRKKHSPLRRLVIAGALIAAEIDRVIRKEKR